MSVFKRNPRISPKDRNALKGAIRRAFARSELHHSVLKQAIVQHSGASRPRVKTWAKCNMCKKIDAKSYLIVDHIFPIIDMKSNFEDMGLDETVDKTWCDISNLQAICKECHKQKTKAENLARKPFRKPKQKSKKT